MDLPLELLRLSLSQRQAKRRLIDSFAERLQLQRRPLIVGELLFRILEPDTAVCAGLGLTLVILGLASGGNRALWTAALGGVLFVLALSSAWITSREARLAAGELKSRMQGWLRNISRDHHIHRGAADGPTTVAVMRDGVWLRLHRNLCVEGDVIKLRAGEPAPGLCSQPAHLTAMCGVHGQSLRPGEVFVPAPLAPSARGVSSSLADDVRSTFVLAETIAVRQLDAALRRQRAPLPPLEVQVSAARRLLLWAVVVTWAQATALQALSWALLADDARRPNSPAELQAWLSSFMLPHLAALALPLLPLALPAFYAVANALGAAYLLTVLMGMPASPPIGRARGIEKGAAGTRAEPVPGLVAGATGWSCWMGGLGASLVPGAGGYWDATDYYERQPEPPTLAGGAARAAIERRGPERLFSHSMAGVVPGSRFVRHAGTSLTYEQWRFLLGFTMRVLRGEPQLCQLRPSRLLASLGSTTVLACPDKRGVLSDGSLSLKQLAFFQPDHAGTAKLTTLDMSKHPAYRFLTRFDDPGWRTHMAVLKPLGLNAVLNSSCRHHDYGASISHTLRAHLLNGRAPRVTVDALLASSPADGTPLHPCLCLLARAIGFSEDVLRRFRRRAEIHLVGAAAASAAVAGRRAEVSAQPPLIMAVVVEDERGSLQVLCRGQPTMVIERCATFWEGESIRPLADEERKQLLACNASMAGNRCLEAVAFSYAPVPAELEWLFPPDDAPQTIVLYDMAPSHKDVSAAVAPPPATRAAGGPTPRGFTPSLSRASSDCALDCAERGVTFALEASASAHASYVSKAATSVAPPVAAHLALNAVGLRAARSQNSSPATARVPESRGLPHSASAQERIDARDDESPPLNSRSARLLRASATSRRADADAAAARKHDAYRLLLDRHVFCGLAGAVDRARVEAADVVEDLFNAGVRFVHLSSDNERRTKAFGHELGLETDWNSCIDLGDETPPSTATASPTLGGGVTKLPRGIDAVRPHLRDVDNVPLLVSMFCNCRDATVREMVTIYQESSELVTMIGSAEAPHSVAALAQADVAVAARPLSSRRCLWLGLEPAQVSPPPRTPLNERNIARVTGSLSASASASAIISGGASATTVAGASVGGAGAAVIPDTSADTELGVAALLDVACCVAVLPERHDLEQLTEWLLQGRSLLANTRQALVFGGFAALLMEFVLVVADWAGLPPPITPFQTLWVALLIVPLLAFPLLLGPIDPRDKKQMVPKNEDHTAGFGRAIAALLVRTLPGVACLVPLFAMLLATAPSAWPAPTPDAEDPTASLGPLDMLLGGGDSSEEPEQLQPLGSLAQRVHPTASVLSNAQLLTQWWLTLLLIAHSASFAHRTLDESSYPPTANRLWVQASALAFGAQNVAVLIQLGPTHVLSVVARVPWYTHLLGVSMVSLVSIVDWLVKRHERRVFEQWNKRMYLEFTTKLGMHSPIEPGHLAPRSYLDE